MASIAVPRRPATPYFYRLPRVWNSGWMRSRRRGTQRRVAPTTSGGGPENDPIDPVGQSTALYRALKRYGVETELVIYPREPHGPREEKHQLDVLTRMVAWFDKYLSAATESH